MEQAKIESEFKRLMGIFTSNPELGKVMNALRFEQLFNPDFLKEHSKFTSMDDIIWRSGFGIVNLLEVENVNQDKWNAYIARNTECSTWHEFGKLAMICWMKQAMKAYEEREE